MSKTIQLKLPLVEPQRTVQQVLQDFHSGDWYYVTKPRTNKMLVMGDNGRWEWVDHNLEGVTPHLFSEKYIAENVAKTWRYTVVTKYNWDIFRPTMDMQ